MGNFVKTVVGTVIALYVAEAVKAVIDDKFQLQASVNRAALSLADSCCKHNNPRMEGGEY